MNILIIEDDLTICADYKLALKLAGHDCSNVSSGPEALNIMTKESFDIAIVDLRLEGDMDGLEIGKRLKIAYPSIRLIMSTGNFEKSLMDASQICKFDACIKKGNLDKLINIVKELSLPCEHGELKGIIGDSQALKSVLYAAKTAADTVNNILITGESGTGKENLAFSIHNMSRRRNRPYVKVNCGAIPQNMIESEFFGHARGSFTSATNQRQGKFQAAHLGTIFLDEIGTLKYDLQQVLLRVLQEGEIDRVGVDIPIPIDVRVISATNSTLEKLVQTKEFREDLFYRLNVFPLTLPPLRERGDDIILLAEHFLTVEGQSSNNKTCKILLPEAKDALMSYHWPGNIRQLKNVITRVYYLTGRWEKILADNICEALSKSSADTEIIKPTKSPSQHSPIANKNTDWDADIVRTENNPLLENGNHALAFANPLSLRDIAAYLNSIKLTEELSGSSKGDIILVENAYLALLRRIITEATKLQRNCVTGGLSFLTGRELSGHITTRVDECLVTGDVPCFKYLEKQPEKTELLAKYKEEKKKKRTEEKEKMTKKDNL